MHHGTSMVSEFLQKGMRCYFSHVAIFVRDPPKDILLQYGVVEHCPTNLYVWESTNEGGTRLVSWLPWIANEAGRNGARYMLVWRKLQGLDPTRKAQLMDVIRQFFNVPYETSLMKLLRGRWKLNRKERLDRVFCSEILAHAYKVAGLLSPKVVASNVITSDFSHFYARTGVLSKHLLDAELQPERRVMLPQSIQPRKVRHERQ